MAVTATAALAKKSLLPAVPEQKEAREVGVGAGVGVTEGEADCVGVGETVGVGEAVGVGDWVSAAGDGLTSAEDPGVGVITTKIGVGLPAVQAARSSDAPAIARIRLTR